MGRKETGYPKGGGEGRDGGPTLQAREAHARVAGEAEAALGRPKTATGEELSGEFPRGGADEKGVQSSLL